MPTYTELLWMLEHAVERVRDLEEELEETERQLAIAEVFAESDSKAESA